MLLTARMMLLTFAKPEDRKEPSDSMLSYFVGYAVPISPGKCRIFTRWVSYLYVHALYGKGEAGHHRYGPTSPTDDVLFRLRNSDSTRGRRYKTFVLHTVHMVSTQTLGRRVETHLKEAIICRSCKFVVCGKPEVSPVAYAERGTDRMLSCVGCPTMFARGHHTL